MHLSSSLQRDDWLDECQHCINHNSFDLRIPTSKTNHRQNVQLGLKEYETFHLLRHTRWAGREILYH